MQFEWDDAKAENNLARHGVELAVIFTERGESIRLISARVAEPSERRFIMKVKLDPNAPLAGKTDWARLKALSPRDALAAAQSDPENPPLTQRELSSMQPAPDPRAIREKLGLSQREFAEAYHLSLATIRDWEQGRYQPDQAARTLLRLIAQEPKLVEQALR